MLSAAESNRTGAIGLLVFPAEIEKKHVVFPLIGNILVCVDMAKVMYKCLLCI